MRWILVMAGAGEIGFRGIIFVITEQESSVVAKRLN
jgi:hypothetical protein